MSATWNTKYGTRRVRHDPPTLEDAIVAAQGVTDDRAAQIEIAADLMSVPTAEVKSAMARLNPDKRATRIVATPSRDKGVRTVVVERKTSRRVVARDDIAHNDIARIDMARVERGKVDMSTSGVTRPSLSRPSLEGRMATLKA